MSKLSFENERVKIILEVMVKAHLSNKVKTTMKINIRTREIDLTDPIRAYAEKKLLALLKFSPDIMIADLELAKISKHHKKGDVFSAKVTLSVPGKVYRVEEIEPVLYKAIDKAKDDLKQSLNRNKGRVRGSERQNHKEVADSLLEVNEI